MRAGLSSLVAQLLYVDAPNLNFAQVVGDIRTAIAAGASRQPKLTWDCDDVALLDLGTTRVVIGFSENLPGRYFTCLTVAVGQAPAPVNPDVTDADYDTLRNMILDRLQDRFPCDDLQIQAFDGPLSSDLIDRVVDAQFQRQVQTQESGQPATPTQDVPYLSLAENGAAEPREMDRLLTRLSTELVARAPSLISRAIASATPKGRDGTAKATKAALSLASGAGARRDASSKAKAGLFWGKGEKPQKITADAPKSQVASAAGRTSSNELKAVRDALYAGDEAQGAAVNGFAARAKQTVKTLVAVPRLLAAKRADKSKTGDQPPASRTNS